MPLDLENCLFRVLIEFFPFHSQVEVKASSQTYKWSFPCSGSFQRERSAGDHSSGALPPSVNEQARELKDFTWKPAESHAWPGSSVTTFAALPVDGNRLLPFAYMLRLNVRVCLVSLTSVLPDDWGLCRDRSWILKALLIAIEHKVKEAVPSELELRMCRELRMWRQLCQAI